MRDSGSSGSARLLTTRTTTEGASVGFFDFLSQRRYEALSYERSRARFRARAVGPTPPPVRSFDEVVKQLAGPVSIPIGTLPDGRVLSVNRDTAGRVWLVAGSSGAGKTRVAIGDFLLHVSSALGMSFGSLPLFSDFGMTKEFVDPKGELAPLCYAHLGALWLRGTDERRELLANLIRVIDVDDEWVTPMPLFDRAASSVSVPYLAELRVQAEDEGADHHSTDLSKHVRGQYYRVLAYLELPLDYAFTERFLYDPVFRSRVMAQIPDRDLRLYWAGIERTVPRQTLAAVLRFIQRRLAYPEIRLSLGIPCDAARRLLSGTHKPRFTIGCFAPRKIPSAKALEQARLRVTDACLEAVLRDSRTRGQLVIDEAAMLFHNSTILEEVLSLAARVFRTTGLGLVLMGQDVANAFPGTLLTSLKLNAVATVLFRSDSTEGDWVFPFVDSQDPALHGNSEAERRRNFLRHVQVLPTRQFYLHVKGAPAIQLTALDVPDPETGTGRSRDELVEIFRSNIAVRSQVRRVDAEEAIAEWEARVVGQLEVPPPVTKAAGKVQSIQDLYSEYAEEDTDGN